MKMEVQISNSKRRKIMIQILYRYLVTDKSLAVLKQEAYDDFQIPDLDDKNKELLIDLLDKVDGYLDEMILHIPQNWRWDRYPKVLVAVMLCAMYEIKILGIPKKVAINEALNNGRSYLPDWDVKFMNPILDKMEKEGIENEL